MCECEGDNGIEDGDNEIDGTTNSEIVDGTYFETNIIGIN